MPLTTIDFEARQAEARPLIAASNPEASAELVDYAAYVIAHYPDGRWRSFLYNLGDHPSGQVRERSIKAHTVLARYELSLSHRVAA